SRSILFTLFLALAPATHAATKADWAPVIHRVEPAIVSIMISAPRAFDTEWNFTGEASGFVVDAERGIILTNRHVVQPGPVIATAIFQDHEEVPLTPIYRDPVHDFGFFRYDPSKLKYIHPKALELAPQEARVGQDIRIIGNDAGEQLSILAGTLARLDRNAPYYGQSHYNDFNTFYFQADSSTSGGSSGSPVINIHGHVIALNAGGETHSSSSFFLPLDRIVPALKRIQADQPVPRGTLQTVFLHRPYNQLDRFGLSAETVQQIRHEAPDASGLLVVHEVIPGGPADGKLQTGDILIAADGRPITGFNALAEILDTHVGGPIRLKLQRGGKPLDVRLQVENLYDITPGSYLEYGGAVLNTLSYEIAHGVDEPVRGVYVADPGFVFSNAGIGRGSIITALGGTPVPDLDALQQVLERYPDGVDVSVRYYTQNNPEQANTALIRLDSHWYPARRCHRGDSGLWPCKPLPAAKPAAPPAPATARYPDYRDPRQRALAPSLVYVEFDMPYRIQGVQETHYVGTGLVVDADKGLVIVDRNTVPVSMGTLTLTFAGSVSIPAKVIYIAPLHNLAVLQYDPALLGDTPVESAEFGEGDLAPGDTVWVAGFNTNRRLVTQATVVSGDEPLNLPLSATLRFRDSNLETIRVVHAPAAVEGVLADAEGRVVALWSSFAWQSGRKLHQTMMGVPLWLVESLIARLEKSATDPTVRSLEVEFNVLPLSQARRRGLPDDWAQRLAGDSDFDRQVLMVSRLTAGGPADGRLQVGDLLLAIDGQPVHDFRQLYTLSQKPAVALTVLRHGKAMKLTLPTVLLDTGALDRVLIWGGAVLQHPPRALAAQRHQPREGVWVAFFNYGSPASRYGLAPGLRIVDVNGMPTPDIDAFLAATAKVRRERQTLRLRTIDPNGRAGLVAMKLQPHYWPAYELVRVDGHWVRRGPE
ncbi:MAG TPA: trypsin-like peptidase domain-containing protein, partial [Gammaproteobacteria bacterium]|nr:trypsin-like peptidase domain-containing protein [Gammaproteobacteria bacterium]